jgi:hypothetical protein
VRAGVAVSLAEQIEGWELLGVLWEHLVASRGRHFEEVVAGFHGSCSRRPSSVAAVLNAKTKWALLFLNLFIYCDFEEDCRARFYWGNSGVSCHGSYMSLWMLVDSNTEFFSEKHSTNVDTHTHTSTHPYEHTHVHPNPMSTSERLS